MSTEKETLQRVQGGLYHLHRAITPVVEARMKEKHGANWLQYVSRSQGSLPGSPLDIYASLKTLLDNWNDISQQAFASGNKRFQYRSFASISFDARNAVSHLNEPLTDASALRYLDAMHELARAMKGHEKEIEEIKRLYEEQRQSGLTQTLTNPAPELPSSKLDLEKPTETASNGTNGTKHLKPWIDIALPHPDVIANRFKESEFAADLFAVDAGLASEGYATPSAFYGITFLTEGLKRVLTTTVQRLGGGGGDPVIGLQTSFGGGKTHTMLAIYHLAKHLGEGGNPQLLNGVGDILDRAGVKALPKPKIAVFVGSSKGTDVSLNLREGPRVHTLWGYIAWRLAGEAGLKLVAEAEAARTSPGSELMVEVFKLAGPSVILLDELTMFARQLDDDRFEAFLSFIQSLTEAAKMVPGILIIGSLPESHAEAGGQRGIDALVRLEKIFGRVQSAWLPASGDETYEIIRRRLFQPLDADGEKTRDETVKAFHDLYKKNPAEFPPETKDSRYLELLRISYPIHPELFDRLSKDWASLPNFQRTRGVLRFMANVVGVLWHGQAKDPLITPARIPVAHEKVRVSVLYPLNPAFSAVVDKEVDGDGSLPSRMEANPSRRMSQMRAASRAARSVFLCSAPLVGQPNAGLTGQGLRLACAEPGDQLAIFGEALRELTERATYLYEESGRYWFSTQPTLNRLAEERAKAFPDYEVDAAITEMLRSDATSKGGFHRVFAAPDDPVTIDEAHALSLVILGPTLTHAGKGIGKSPATDVMSDVLMRCRSSQRRFRNTLMFVVPDEANLATAREVVRKSLAWASIDKDARLRQEMTAAQTSDATDKARSHRDSALKAVRAAWSHILYPVKSQTPGKPFDLEHDLITARDRSAIPIVVYDKLKADGQIREKLGSDNFWLSLKDIWPEDRPHLMVTEIAEWFATYVYLPKIRDKVVLEISIRDAVAKLDPQFGYAEDFDEATGKYHKLLWASNPPEFLPPTAVIVRDYVTKRQLDSEGVIAPKPITVVPTTPAEPRNNPTPSPVAPILPSKPRRFYGSVEIDMGRPVKAFDTILNAVVMELQRANGAKIKLTLEIEAEASEGFDDGEIGVVRDNARQLKFKSESTGFSD